MLVKLLFLLIILDISVSLDLTKERFLSFINSTIFPFCLFNMFVACVLKVFLNWTLTANPNYGICGAAFASVCDFAIAAFLNLIFVYKLTGYSLNFLSVIKPLMAAFVMGGEIYFLLQKFTGAWALLSAFILAIPVYFVALWLLRGLTKEDIKSIPFVGKLVFGVLSIF